ncbi:hypothetical protein CPARA_1gp088 (nucleomorph) [Cryptomonas paramecium]|uniref:Uncharacterized protein n=1 Tax=Cryptomonas paramaecium TaxID=2898 RepID=F2HHF0_9CRYP|nr:hypothetical protein CPARA_1gp088 [Cryptomonas paramecium]AEA38746.1 hypothetical protein CPARA_1gp088 [Cryptomonas paramecium]|mmetsp:Transcript_74476/g.199071  ORF Transcript_74476/g.199071 Transcript_74476/m.199071 type:complete len:187 (+) Transcript_74476:928-1488(+)
MYSVAGYKKINFSQKIGCNKKNTCITLHRQCPLKTECLGLKNFSFFKINPINLSLHMINLSNTIDISALDVTQEDVINNSFLFSSKTIKFSEVEVELKDIEKDERRCLFWKDVQTGLVLGGSAIGIWVFYEGLTTWEKWIKEQEKKNIQEEIELTGIYIDPNASNVETSIDPITGKKIQIKSEKDI